VMPEEPVLAWQDLVCANSLIPLVADEGAGGQSLERHRDPALAGE
jgi:hypothetical protein